MSCLRHLASAVLALSLAAFAQSPRPAAPVATSPSSASELIAADRAIWQAIAGPRPSIDRVAQSLAPDYIDVDAGIIHSRGDVLKDLQDLRDFSFHYDHPRAVMLSPTTGYVVAELTFRSVAAGVVTTGRVLTTSLFALDHGQWISHLHTEMDIKP